MQFVNGDTREQAYENKFSCEGKRKEKKTF